MVLADGTRRWGLYGAAGLLVRHVEPGDGRCSYFVALRSQLTHMGGTWAVPGGALGRDETPVEAAVREFREEVGMALAPERVALVHEDDHGGWSYWTVVVDLPSPFDAPTRLHWETSATAWVTADELAGLDLHPAFRAALLRLELLPA